MQWRYLRTVVMSLYILRLKITGRSCLKNHPVHIYVIPLGNNVCILHTSYVYLYIAYKILYNNFCRRCRGGSTNPRKYIITILYARVVPLQSYVNSVHCTLYIICIYRESVLSSSRSRVYVYIYGVYTLCVYVYSRINIISRSNRVGVRCGIPIIPASCKCRMNCEAKTIFAVRE